MDLEPNRSHCGGRRDLPRRRTAALPREGFRPRRPGGAKHSKASEIHSVRLRARRAIASASCASRSDLIRAGLARSTRPRSGDQRHHQTPTAGSRDRVSQPNYGAFTGSPARELIASARSHPNIAATGSPWAPIVCHAVVGARQEAVTASPAANAAHASTVYPVLCNAGPRSRSRVDGSKAARLRS